MPQSSGYCRFLIKCAMLCAYERISPHKAAFMTNQGGRSLVSSDISGSIILLVVLLIFSFYFSATETSITAAGKGKLLALSDEYPHRRKGFFWLADNTAKAINVTLIGNNVVNIAASAVATTLALKFFGALGPALAVAVMTILIVIFCAFCS